VPVVAVRLDALIVEPVSVENVTVFVLVALIVMADAVNVD